MALDPILVGTCSKCKYSQASAMDWILPPLEPQNETSGVPQWWSEPLFCAVSIVKYVRVVEVKFCVEIQQCFSN